MYSYINTDDNTGTRSQLQGNSTNTHLHPTTSLRKMHTGIRRSLQHSGGGGEIGTLIRPVIDCGNQAGAEWSNCMFQAFN